MSDDEEDDDQEVPHKRRRVEHSAPPDLVLSTNGNLPEVKGTDCQHLAAEDPSSPLSELSSDREDVVGSASSEGDLLMDLSEGDDDSADSSSDDGDEESRDPTFVMPSSQATSTDRTVASEENYASEQDDYDLEVDTNDAGTGHGDGEVVFVTDSDDDGPP
ncbi:hypothetical protein P389DRAFT_101341 [Cystobasidium minutum MCA 4210]|uniref:uncharacterized protein n=1 Tax=Cystobasidium minutum MCA 4210 TaxID=1397322 RepID=UPI0034CE8FFB|eukprot:jgi/Rhomi1/101341/CE101340_156